MRVVVATLISMAVSASAFGVARSPVKSTALAGLPETITAEVQEKEDKAERWRAIRHLSDEEAKAQLSGEELESYNNYHASVKQDIERAVEVATLMLKDLEPERIKPKSKKQVKRDKWAKVSTIAAARAAAK
jgi:hypothetical protein